MQTIRTNLQNKASTQYDNFNFTSMCVFNGVILGASNEGLFRACCGADDNGTDIDAYFIPYETDFGITQNKRVRRVYTTGTFGADFRLTITGNGTQVNGPYDISTVSADDEQIRRFSINRINSGGKVKFVSGKFKFENINGSDFTVDSAEVFCNLHNRRI